MHGSLPAHDTRAATPSRCRPLGGRFAFLAVMAFSTVPTPLYTIYQARDGFSTFLITLIFAAYAVGVMSSCSSPGMSPTGMGRRRGARPGGAVELSARSSSCVWRELPGPDRRPRDQRPVGRRRHGDRDGLRRRAASRRAARGIAGTARSCSRRPRTWVGSASGPLVAGLLAQTVGAPLTRPVRRLRRRAAHGGCARCRARAGDRDATRSPAGLPAAACRRPCQRRAAVLRGRRGRLRRVRGVRPVHVARADVPGRTLDHPSHALAGVPAFTAFTAAVVAQLAARAWELRRVITTGTAALSAGVLLVVAGTWLVSLAPFLAGGALAGAGAGLLFKGGVVTVSGLAAPERQAEVLAGFFLAGYVGISVPVLGLGVLDQWVAPRLALLVFAAVLLAGIATSANSLLGRDRRAPGRRRPLTPSAEY